MLMLFITGDPLDMYAEAGIVSVLLVIFQVILCLKCHKTIIKLLPLLILVASGIACGIWALFASGWSSLGPMIIGIMLGILFVAIVVAWCIYGIIYAIQQHINPNRI